MNQHPNTDNFPLTSLFPKGTTADRYKKLELNKNFYIESAKECCLYTIPSLLCFFEEGGKNWQDMPLSFQSIGARGVSNLASKLLNAVTPATAPMFRLMIDDSRLSQEIEQQDEKEFIRINEALTAYAQEVQNCLKASGDYAHMFEVWQLLLVSGNVLIADPEDNGSIRVYSLRDFVIKRDRSGNVSEIILRESIPANMLPNDVAKDTKALPSSKDSESYFDLYTHAVKYGDRFYIRQECNGHIISGSLSIYPAHACPFIPIRMYAGAGEDYSRSFVSNYLGDLKTVDALCKWSAEGAAMAAKHIYLVRPDGLTEINDVEDTPNGGVIYGRADDIGVMQSGKGYDLRAVSDEAAKIEKRLSQAFLLLDGGIRNAERVTREEIRSVAAELERALGGIYSVMCHSFQMPYILRKIWKLQRLGKIKPLDKRISPVIVTGLEALGMSGDKEKLVDFFTLAEKLLGAGSLEYINEESLIRHLANLMGINTAGLIKTAEQVSQTRIQAEKNALTSALIQKVLPSIINNASDLQKVADNMFGLQFDNSNPQQNINER